jgi:hypothetical protein
MLIIDLAVAHRLPAVYPFCFFATAGGLISYGFDGVDQFRQVATHVDRVLKGDKPADLPAQAPTKFELVMQITADDVIEWQCRFAAGGARFRPLATHRLWRASARRRPLKIPPRLFPKNSPKVMRCKSFVG